MRNRRSLLVWFPNPDRFFQSSLRSTGLPDEQWFGLWSTIFRISLPTHTDSYHALASNPEHAWSYSALAADRRTGCRNFTIAHEAAHQILADLFPNDYGKAVKCRGHIAYRERNGKPSWEEWQADTLAAELLMPTFLINAEIERVASTLPNGILYKSVSDPNYEKILEMAARMGVSWSAIRIRLQQMQVINGKPIHCHPLDIIRFGE